MSSDSQKGRDEDMLDVYGTKYFVDSNCGMIKFVIVVKGLYFVTTMHQQNNCSISLLEKIVTILSKCVELWWKKVSHLNDMKKLSDQTSFESIFYCLAFKLTVRVLSFLTCDKCNYSDPSRSDLLIEFENQLSQSKIGKVDAKLIQHNQSLLVEILNIWTLLITKSRPLFLRNIRRVIRDNTLPSLLKLFHSLFNFCKLAKLNENQEADKDSKIRKSFKASPHDPKYTDVRNLWISKGYLLLFKRYTNFMSISLDESVEVRRDSTLFLQSFLRKHLSYQFSLLANFVRERFRDDHRLVILSTFLEWDVFVTKAYTIFSRHSSTPMSNVNSIPMDYGIDNNSKRIHSKKLSNVCLQNSIHSDCPVDGISVNGDDTTDHMLNRDNMASSNPDLTEQIAFEDRKKDKRSQYLVGKQMLKVTRNWTLKMYKNKHYSHHDDILHQDNDYLNTFAPKYGNSLSHNTFLDDTDYSCLSKSTVDILNASLTSMITSDDVMITSLFNLSHLSSISKTLFFIHQTYGMAHAINEFHPSENDDTSPTFASNSFSLKTLKHFNEICDSISTHLSKKKELPSNCRDEDWTFSCATHKHRNNLKGARGGADCNFMTCVELSFINLLNEVTSSAMSSHKFPSSFTSSKNSRGGDVSLLPNLDESGEATNRCLREEMNKLKAGKNKRRWSVTLYNMVFPSPNNGGESDSLGESSSGSSYCNGVGGEKKNKLLNRRRVSLFPSSNDSIQTPLNKVTESDSPKTRSRKPSFNFERGIHSRASRQSIKLRRNAEKRSSKHSAKKESIDETNVCSSSSCKVSDSKSSSLNNTNFVMKKGGGSNSQAILPLPSPDLHDASVKSVEISINFLQSLNFTCLHQFNCVDHCYKRQLFFFRIIQLLAKRLYGQHSGYEFVDVLSDEYNEEELTIGCGGGVSESISESNNHLQMTGSRNHDNNMITVTNGDSHFRTFSKFNIIEEKKNGVSVRNETFIRGMISSEQKWRSKDQLLWRFMDIKIGDFFQAILIGIAKNNRFLTESMLTDLFPIAWRLLLDNNINVVMASTLIVDLSCLRMPILSKTFIIKHMHHPIVCERIKAVLSFQILWKYRYHVWLRFDDKYQMKAMSSQIEFTLPSPKLGVENINLVNSPWQMSYRSRVRGNVFQRNDDSRLKSVKKDSMLGDQVNESARHNIEKRSYPITNNSILTFISKESNCVNFEDQDDQSNNIRDLSSDEHRFHNSGYRFQRNDNCIFPSVLGSLFNALIDMLDSDTGLSSDGVSLQQIVFQVLNECMMEDAKLFFRNMMGELTRSNSKYVLKQIRSVVSLIIKLPSQTAFTLYNYIVGYIMFLVRQGKKNSIEFVGDALSTLWMTVHSVQGIMFKDLKQILRKEQVDSSILITANVPFAKKIVVYSAFSNVPPCQFQLNEEIKFHHIINDAAHVFGLQLKDCECFAIKDFKTGVIHNPEYYVRDYYFFKRLQSPEVQLVVQDTSEYIVELQNECLKQKLGEIGKIMLTWGILKNVTQVVQRVVFLHDDLIKLPSFPRKALQSELDLFLLQPYGKELYVLDVIHKFNWIRLIARMFESMAGNFTRTSEIKLLINVINGALIIHGEEMIILRYVIATLINAVSQFRTIFAQDGFLLFLPHLLTFYAYNQHNQLIVSCVEYACQIFHTLHRKHFLLQLFACFASNEDAIKCINETTFIQLLFKMNSICPDNLRTTELIKMKQPLYALDFCYQDECHFVTFTDCLSLCALTIAYDPTSQRAIQMLVVMKYIISAFATFNGLNIENKNYRDCLHSLPSIIKTLLSNCEDFTRFYSGPGVNDEKCESLLNSKKSKIDMDDDSIIHLSSLSDDAEYSGKSSRGYKSTDTSITSATSNAVKCKLQAFVLPRHLILQVASEFIVNCQPKINELSKKGHVENTFEIKNYARLAEIAQTIFKILAGNNDSVNYLQLDGLKSYMVQVFPKTDWSMESIRPILLNIVKKMEKIVCRIRQVKGCITETLLTWIKAIHSTLWKHPYLVNIANIKSLINLCWAINFERRHFYHSHKLHSSIPFSSTFSNMVFQLMALQSLILGSTYSLQQRIESLSLIYNNQFKLLSKRQVVMINVLLPFCLRVACSKKELPTMRMNDIQYTLDILLALVTTLYSKTSSPFLSLPFKSDLHSTSRNANQHSLQITLVGLKLLCHAYPNQMNCDWFRISRCLISLFRSKRLNEDSDDLSHVITFLRFILTDGGPLFTLLLPLIEGLPDMKFDQGVKLKQRSGVAFLANIDSDIDNILSITSINKHETATGRKKTTFERSMKSETNVRLPQLENHRNVSEIIVTKLPSQISKARSCRLRNGSKEFIKLSSRSLSRTPSNDDPSVTSPSALKSMTMVRSKLVKRKDSRSENTLRIHITSKNPVLINDEKTNTNGNREGRFGIVVGTAVTSGKQIESNRDRNTII